MTMPEEPTPMGQHFSSGYAAGRGPMSPGLEVQGQRWSELGAASAEHPNSVLQQISPSPIAANLSAPSQQSRLLPNGFVLGNNANGASPTTTSTVNYLKMSGQPE